MRNFPLGHAYERDGVGLIVAFRYLPQYPEGSGEWLGRLRRRLARFGRVPPVRAIVTELHEAEERAARGEPAHWGDLLVRLMRVAVQQNSVLEERFAREKDESIAELRALRDGVLALVEGDRELAARVADRFAAASFPFRGDRLVPRITVRAGADGAGVETTSWNPAPWTEEAKRTLIDRGRALLDAELRARDLC